MDIEYWDSIAETYGADVAQGMLGDRPRPAKPEPKEWDGERKAPEFGFLVNPRNQVMVYGEDHIGKEIEVIQYLPSEQVYVVRFEWGLGCVDYDMVDFRTQAEREIEDLQHDLMGILPFCEYTDDQIKEMAKILHTQGYRKPDADLVRKGDS